MGKIASGCRSDIHRPTTRPDARYPGTCPVFRQSHASRHAPVLPHRLVLGYLRPAAPPLASDNLILTTGTDAVPRDGGNMTSNRWVPYPPPDRVSMAATELPCFLSGNRCGIPCHTSSVYPAGARLGTHWPTSVLPLTAAGYRCRRAPAPKSALPPQEACT